MLRYAPCSFRLRARALSAVAGTMLLLGLASCGDSGKEEPTTAPAPTSTASDSGGETSDGGGGSENGDEEADGRAAPEASDGSGEQVIADETIFPEPNPADFPGLNTHTEQGAMETVKYFWALVYWSAWSGDFATVESLYNEECASCEEVIVSARDSYREGSYISPSATVPVDISVVDGYEEYDSAVAYDFDERPTDKNRVNDGVKHSTGAVLMWRDGAWEIVGLETHDRDTGGGGE